MTAVLALLLPLLGQLPAPLPAPTPVYRELRLTVDAPRVTHGQPWLHLSRDGADWGGAWHLMGWQTVPLTGPDYQTLVLYLRRLPPGNGKIVAFAVDWPGCALQGTAATLNRLTLTRNVPAATANRSFGLGALWVLCEGAP